MEGKFPCAACRKDVGINFDLCQFSRCWVHERCSGIRDKLKEDGKFKCQTCENQQTDIAEDCPGTKLNGQSPEIVEEFCYLDDTIEARGGAFDSFITRIMSQWYKFKDLVVEVCP